MNKLAIFTIFALVCAMAIVIECKPTMSQILAEAEHQRHVARELNEMLAKLLNEGSPQAAAVNKREWDAEAQFGWGRR